MSELRSASVPRQSREEERGEEALGDGQAPVNGQGTHKRGGGGGGCSAGKGHPVLTEQGALESKTRGWRVTTEAACR